MYHSQHAHCRTAERIYAIIVMAIAVTLFGYITASMGTYMDSVDRVSKSKRDAIERMESYIKAKHLSRPLRSKIRDHYLLQWNKRGTGRGGTSAGDYDDSMLEELPQTLQTDVINEVFRDVIAQTPIFRGKDSAFVTSFLKRCHSLALSSAGVLAKEGAIGTALYLLCTGRLDMKTMKGEVVAQLPAGSVFGEIALLMTGKHVVSAAAVGFCELLVMSRENLVQLLGDWPEFEEELRAVCLLRLKVIKEARDATRSKGDLATRKFGTQELHPARPRRATLTGIGTNMLEGFRRGRSSVTTMARTLAEHMAPLRHTPRAASGEADCRTPMSCAGSPVALAGIGAHAEQATGSSLSPILAAQAARVPYRASVAAVSSAPGAQAGAKAVLRSSPLREHADAGVDTYNNPCAHITLPGTPLAHAPSFMYAGRHHHTGGSGNVLALPHLQSLLQVHAATSIGDESVIEVADWEKNTAQLHGEALLSPQAAAESIASASDASIERALRILESETTPRLSGSLQAATSFIGNRSRM